MRVDRTNPLPLLFAIWLASALVLSISDRADPDLWGHVRYGADALAAGRLPSTTTHAFTAAGAPWVNHEWIAELAFAAAARLGGGGGLTALKTLLGLGLFALVIARGRGMGLAALATTVLLAAGVVSPGWSCRPQIFGFAAFALLIVLLDRTFRESRPRSAWLIPPLFVVWVNVHGSFVAGLAVLVVYVATHVAEETAQDRNDRARTDARRGALVVAASAGALLCTPYGFAFVPWVLHAVTMQRPAISEWQSLGTTDPALVPFMLLVTAMIAAGWRHRARVPWAHVAVTVVVAWQAVRHTRHAPFLAVLAALWLPPLSPASAGAERAQERDPAGAPAVVRGAAWAVVAILALAVGLRVHAPWVDRDIYPVDAFAFMRTHNLTGRLIAHFDWAQYAIYAFAPETSLQFDGRFETAYPEAVADAHFDFVLGDQPERPVAGPPARILESGAPELVLLSRRYPQPLAIMRERPDWVLLYRDAIAELWGLRAKYDDPRSGSYVAAESRAISDQSANGRVAWPGSS